MKTKLLLTIIALFLISCKIYTQNCFEYLYSSDYFKLPTSTIETSDNDYILCFHSLDSNFYTDYFQFVKINETGELIKTKKYSEIDSVIIFDIIVNTDSTFLCFGNRYNPPDSNKFVVYCINNELEMMYSEEYFIGKREYGYLRSNFNSNGNIVFSSMANIYDYEKRNSSVLFDKDIALKTINYGLILYELSPDGDSIQSKLYTDTYIEPYHIVEKPDKTGYFLFGYTNLLETYPTGNNYITELDYNFNPVQENEVPLAQVLSLRTNARNLGASKIIYTGWDFYQNEQRFETITIVDNDLNVIANQQLFLSDEDTNINCSHKYNLDFVDENNIYVSAIYNFENIPYQFEPSWILLTNFDSLLNKRWQKFYGGDAFYFPWSTLATSDGGCIVLGYRWDFNIADIFQNEIFVLKVDSSGNITSIYGPEISTNEINIFPNPGTDVLNLSLLPNLKANRFELYDITGKLIFEKEIFSKMESFNVSFLKSGLYFYKIYTSDNNIYSGKWIKQ